jgi:TOMM system kinase/cyclase fusion protein
MRCPNCGFENPARMKFCGQCGAPLANRCQACGAENPPGFKFCGECGAALQGAARAPVAADFARGNTTCSSPPADSILPGAERRQLTVMFCDLVDSTALSERIDPEDLRAVLRDYQAVCAKVIRRFEGYVAKYLGDGLLVYFGYPQAHEDDAMRAVHAGLGIVEAMERLNARIQQERGVKLDIRLGIHTGLVVAGDMDRSENLEERAIVGAAPNIAARIQSFAEPNTLVISEATHRLIQGYFQCLDIGDVPLKGISQPIPLYRVLYASVARSRLDVAGSKGLTPLVGREREVARMLEAWHQARAGNGQALVISGEAGIGKSRLVQKLKEHVARDTQSWLTECRCSPYQQNTALYPVIDLLERVVLEFDRDTRQEEKLGRLEGFLVQYGLPLEETVPLLASLLSIPLNDAYAPLDMNPQRQKQKTLEALLTLLLERAARQPVLFVVEDLHWADPSMLEFLDLALTRVPTARLLAVFTHRPEFIFQPSARTRLDYMMLTRLPHEETEAMVHSVTGGKALPSEVLDQIVRKADGVPLFVEELTRTVLESGLLREREDRYELTGPLPSLAIPATLQGSLMARLDRLSAVKMVAQLGAVLGREFTYELIRAVSPLDEATLQRELAALAESGLLFQRGAPPQATYVFKHALIQDAAYQSLLKSVRQQFHQQTAKALVEQFPETAQNSPELLAHHYTEAGLTASAIPYWQQAAQRAIHRSANLEAIAHLGRALELLATQPDTSERAEQEMALQLMLGTAWIAIRGYSAPEVEHAFTRARELSGVLGEAHKAFPALWGLWAYYVVRADFKTAQELGQEMLALAESRNDAELLLEVQPVLVHNYFWTGDFETARAHAEQGISLYDMKRHRAHAVAYGQDPGVVCLSYLSWILWLLGYPDQALARSREAIRLATDSWLGHAYSLGYALAFAAFFHHFRQEPEAARERAEAAIALAAEHGFPIWLADGDMIRGWALAAQGQAEEGMVQLQRGLDAWEMAGAKLCRTQQLALLAESLGRSGRTQEGLDAIADSLAMARETGESHFLPELHRLRGTLLLSLDGSNAEQAEACFRQALESARGGGAKSWELRATTSLCRLWQAQGKADAAREMLTGILCRFEEGFGTPDLLEARALLDTLT